MELLKEILEQAESLTDELTNLRREFHQHPELSHEKERTAGVVARYLQDLGVVTGVAGHGVVGTLTAARPGKTVAWRADMDALPPVGESGRGLVFPGAGGDARLRP